MQAKPRTNCPNNGKCYNEHDVLYYLSIDSIVWLRQIQTIRIRRVDSTLKSLFWHLPKDKSSFSTYLWRFVKYRTFARISLNEQRAQKISSFWYFHVFLVGDGTMIKKQKTFSVEWSRLEIKVFGRGINFACTREYNYGKFACLLLRYDLP